MLPQIQIPADSIDTARNLFTIVGSLVAFLAAIPRLFRWWNRPKLRVENLGIHYDPVTRSIVTYNYEDREGAHAITARIDVDFTISNPKRKLKRKQVHATGVRWAIEISESKTGRHIYGFSEDIETNILGPSSTLPRTKDIPTSIFTPELRVYVYVVCREGSSTTLDKIVKVERRLQLTVAELLGSASPPTSTTPVADERTS